MQTTSDKPAEEFPRRFFGFGIRGFMLLALILLLIEIVLILMVFGTDFIFASIEPNNFAAAAQQASQTIRQNAQSCIMTVKTLGLFDS